MFPLLGTTDNHQFGAEESAAAAVAALEPFLVTMTDRAKFTVVFVGERGSPELAAFSGLLGGGVVGADARVRVCPGSIVEPAAAVGAPVTAPVYLVNETNWRFKAKSGHINKAVHAAAGPDFSKATKAKHSVGEQWSGCVRCA